MTAATFTGAVFEPRTPSAGGKCVCVCVSSCVCVYKLVCVSVCFFKPQTPSTVREGECVC